MRYEIILNEAASVIYVTMDSPRPRRINFVGYDATKRDTVYFAISKTVHGRRTIELPMPITPDTLTLDIVPQGGGFGSHMNVIDIKVHDMPPTVTPFTKESLEFYHLLKKIAKETGELKPGFYTSKDENCVIWVKEHLDGDATPARINRRTSVVKWNLSQMRGYTVFMRIFMGLHERQHYDLQSTDEVKVDTASLKQYLVMNYPASEANYAMTKVFDNSNEAKARAANMDRIIKQNDRMKMNKPIVRQAA